jgi:hypothetical protein
MLNIVMVKVDVDNCYGVADWPRFAGTKVLVLLVVVRQTQKDRDKL